MDPRFSREIARWEGVGGPNQKEILKKLWCYVGGSV